MPETITITLQPTEVIRRVNGEPAREWVGSDDTGAPVVAMIRNVSPQTHDAAVNDRFARILQEVGRAEAAPVAIDMQMVI